MDVPATMSTQPFNEVIDPYSPEEHRRPIPLVLTASMSPQVNVALDKQQRILDIIDRWKTYQVDVHLGIVLRVYNKGGEGSNIRKIKHYVNEAGRPNFHIHYRFGNDGCDYEVISCFHLIWLVAYGVFNPKLRLRPMDGDWLNYKISNITVDLPLRKELVENGSIDLTTEFKRKVRFKEIQEIKSIMGVNSEVRPIEISRSLKLNYFSVQRAMSRIRLGLSLRFETQGPYRQQKDPYMHYLPTDI